MSILKVNTIQKKDGTQFPLVGQVVNNQTDATFTNTSTSYAEFSDIATTITPSSTSAKILVTVSLMAGGYRNASSGAQENTGIFIICRDSSSNVISQKRYENYQYDASGTQSRFGLSCSFLDTPNTTSPVTYRVYGRCLDAVGVQIGQTSDSEMTLMEVLA